MNVRDTIRAALHEIMAANHRVRPIEDSSEIVRDLGFTSLDVAELVAVLEMELEVDPFSNGVSLMEARTYADFCRVYEAARVAQG